jgi:hypothetical protein
MVSVYEAVAGYQSTYNPPMDANANDAENTNPKVPKEEKKDQK